MVRYIPLHSLQRNERRRRREAAWLQLGMGVAGGLMIAALMALPLVMP